MLKPETRLVRHSAGKAPAAKPDHLNPTPGPRRQERTSYREVSSDPHTRAHTHADIQNKQRGMQYLTMGTIRGSHFSFLCGYVSLRGHTLMGTVEARGQMCKSFSGIIHLCETESLVGLEWPSRLNWLTSECQGWPVSTSTAPR